ncbi:uncharacterized membrane protein YqaE (UPF0057 family) [Polaromonas sp. CG_9.5]|uniref:YqaE/Pmp3 family membrane protein n=1 Tax=Polaromonas sp. CG_9.5 TaxID=3071705 RepID=UPI002E0697BB|nr:uncharacterized membrane protein YqaE (UPF0057 family) [Polaromonas sp. CG_9.5]
MLYIIALFAPFLVVMIRGKIFTGIALLVCQITLIGWIPAIIVAWIIIRANSNNNRSTKGEKKCSNVFRNFILSMNDDVKENPNFDVLEAAKQAGINPQLVLTTVSSAILFDYAQRKILLVDNEASMVVTTYNFAEHFKGRFIIYIGNKKFNFIDNIKKIDEIERIFYKFWDNKPRASKAKQELLDLQMILQIV